MEQAHTGIFNSFRKLTGSQLRENSRYVILFAAPFVFIAIGVAIAVLTGIVWVGSIAGGIGLVGLIYICGHIKYQYTPRFGKKYNLLRFGIAGLLLYQHTAWNGLRGIYNLLAINYGYSISMKSFCLSVILVSGLMTALSAYGLSKTNDLREADLLGICEVFGFVLAFGAIFLSIL